MRSNGAVNVRAMAPEKPPLRNSLRECTTHRVFQPVREDGSTTVRPSCSVACRDLSSRRTRPPLPERIGSLSPPLLFRRHLMHFLGRTDGMLGCR